MNATDQFIQDAIAAMDQAAHAISIGIRAKLASTDTADQQRVQNLLHAGQARLREARMLFTLAGGQTPQLNNHPAIVEMERMLGRITDQISDRVLNGTIELTEDGEDLEDALDRHEAAADALQIGEFACMSALVHLSAAIDLIEKPTGD